jgi:hypothetical protein
MSPEVLFLTALMGIFACYVVWRGMHPVQQQAEMSQPVPASAVPDQPQAPQSSPAQNALAEFYRMLAERAPSYISREVACPLDNTILQLPVIERLPDGRLKDNSVGGIATDMMKIAVGPPIGSSPQPDLLKQQWELLPVSCPSCGNTYQEIDINNLRHPSRLQALKENWNLAELSPGLAAVPAADWTPDVVQFGHYLSSREAQTEHIELAYIALSGAYASNFVVWSGEHAYHIPSAAFYALAAAELQTAIELGWEGLPDKSKSETIMTLLECQRLLGRREAALQTLELARQILQLEPALKPVLEMQERYIADEHYALERVNLDNRPAPPIGWQLDLMLPAMNGHIAQYRQDWQAEQAPAAIVAEINALLIPPEELP